jgi:hypothetical protein
MTSKHDFSFENLEIWQEAVNFAELVIKGIDCFETPRKHYMLIEQLEAALTSSSMNACPVK